MSAAAQARGASRRRGLRELALIAAVYAAYDISRLLVQGRRSSAIGNATQLLHVERLTGIAWEQTVNGLVSAHRGLGVAADYLYATLHYTVTPLVLLWLWRRHGAIYSRARSTLMVTTLLALVGLTLLPVAPPRMLPGFVDTMSKYAQFGWWGADASAPRGLGHLTNEFAAMPSLHVGWALWCGWQLMRHARRRVVRLLGLLYPVVTSVVVVGTANHFVLDVVAGAAVLGAGAAATMAMARLRRPRVIDLMADVPADLAELPAQRDRGWTVSVAEATTDRTAGESVVIPSTPRVRS